jgi:hypothetical protein
MKHTVYRLAIKVHPTFTNEFLETVEAEGHVEPAKRLTGVEEELFSCKKTFF